MVYMELLIMVWMGINSYFTTRGVFKVPGLKRKKENGSATIEAVVCHYFCFL